MNLIDGKKISTKFRKQLAKEIEQLKEEFGKVPGLAVVLVGDNQASQTYVSSKEKACRSVGIYSESYQLPRDTNEEDLIKLIDSLNKKDMIHGILVQLPLPNHIDEKKIIERINPQKDVDGFHPINIGNLVIGDEGFISCTPYGIIKLLEEEGIDIEGKEAVVVGRSNIVGKPMAILLLQKNATVTIAHSRTKNLIEVIKRADILIAAVGKPNFIKSDMVKEGAVVIDVGINRIEKKLVGDVDFEEVKEKTSYITPVPGGVGPMTITMLLFNTVKSAKKMLGKDDNK